VKTADKVAFRGENKHKVLRQLSLVTDAAAFLKQESGLFTENAEEPYIAR